MKELMISLLTWIGSQTGYNVNIHLPNVVMTTQHNMCALYGIHQKQSCEASGLKAFYDKNLTIYLGTDFDPYDINQQSRLLHELVHYVQWSNNENRQTCLGHLEVEAYDIQDKWRNDRDLQPILAEFNRIMLEASCDA